MVNRVFIYGEFENEGSLPTSLTPPPRFRDTLSPVAIEVLREFSPLELIGKIYVLVQSGSYQPLTPLGVRNYTWYKEYRMASLGDSSARFSFAVKDGDKWRVLWMRQESDDSGPYIAVALKHD